MVPYLERTRDFLMRLEKSCRFVLIGLLPNFNYLSQPPVILHFTKFSNQVTSGFSRAIFVYSAGSIQFCSNWIVSVFDSYVGWCHCCSHGTSQHLASWSNLQRLLRRDARSHSMCSIYAPEILDRLDTCGLLCLLPFSKVFHGLVQPALMCWVFYFCEFPFYFAYESMNSSDCQAVWKMGTWCTALIQSRETRVVYHSNFVGPCWIYQKLVAKCFNRSPFWHWSLLEEWFHQLLDVCDYCPQLRKKCLYLIIRVWRGSCIDIGEIYIAVWSNAKA